MKKITVKICSGTTCFVMGGNYFTEAAELIESKFGDRVEVLGSPCLNQCSSHSKAPFAKIDNDVISEVTTEKLIVEIEKRLSENE